MSHVIAFATGLLFALGLGIGGMTQPAKIVGFLDIAGSWDPTLLFVMAGAVSTYMLAYRWIRGRALPLYATRFQIPSIRTVDGRLLFGSALFGVGWGMSGFCPGPALTSAITGHPAVWVVLTAMIAGILLFDFTPLGSPRRSVPPAAMGPSVSPTDA